MSAAERRALRLTLFDDAAGGLNFRLSDQRSLALHAHQALGDGVLARWRAADGPLAATPATAADRRLLGLAMAEALFPAPVHEVLARQPGGWLHLQLAEALTGLPWEWAALPGLMATQPAARLDERFIVVRQVMARGAPAASLRHRKPGALLQYCTRWARLMNRITSTARNSQSSTGPLPNRPTKNCSAKGTYWTHVARDSP